MSKMAYKIRRATDQDLVHVNQLLVQHGLNEVGPEYLKHDLSLVAESGGKVVGFVWCGVMANKTLGYVDYYLVDPDYAGLGVGSELGKRIVSVCKKKGIKKVFGIIGHHKYHDRCLVNAETAGLRSSPMHFTYVCKEI